VIELELGDSIAVNWRNQLEVHLDSADIAQNAHYLTTCDAVLMTFEVPSHALQRALAVVHTARSNRPSVIVTPGQPYTDDEISRYALSQIDYLVANAWELKKYCPPGLAGSDPDPVAMHLLATGVQTVCMLSQAGCRAYSEGMPVIVKPAASSFYKETQAARDAFCAALAAWLIDNDREFREDAVAWATAAMSCATSDFPLSNSMPDRERIEQSLG
jgi:ribokinase